MAVKLFQPYIQRWKNSLPGIALVADKLNHWIYYEAFGVMSRTIEQQAKTISGISEEVDRMPILLTHFLTHLEALDVAHIDPDERTFFKDELAGDVSSFFRWRDAGYDPIAAGGLPRTAKTYAFRLASWEKIYAGTYTTKSGSSVTYEQVINARMAGGIAGKEVPYWMLWNYGSSSITGRPGSPSYGGIHFIEAGEQALPAIRSRAMTQFMTYVKDSFVSGKEVEPRVLRDTEWKNIYASYRGTE